MFELIPAMGFLLLRSGFECSQSENTTTRNPQPAAALGGPASSFKGSYKEGFKGYFGDRCRGGGAGRVSSCAYKIPGSEIAIVPEVVCLSCRPTVSRMKSKLLTAATKLSEVATRCGEAKGKKAPSIRGRIWKRGLRAFLHKIR